MPTEPATIIPYYAPEKGEMREFGSSKIGDYYFGAPDENGKKTDLTGDPEYALTVKYEIVDGNAGKRITAPRALGKDVSFRSATALRRNEGQQMDYHYTFTNFSAAEIKFTVFQMKGGHDWTDETTFDKSDPITLASGASTSVTVRAEVNKDDSNTLTLIKIDEEMTESLDLGVAMATENTSPEVTVTLDLPEGFRVEGYNTTVRKGDKLVLPKSSQITNETGRNFIRWTDADGAPIEDGKLTVKGDITIKPELSEFAKIAVDLPSGITLKNSYVTDCQTGDELVLPKDEDLSATSIDGRKILGWYDKSSNALLSEGQRIVEKTMTIAPYFAARTGTAVMCNYGDSTDGKPLVFNNIQGTLYPLTVYDESGKSMSESATGFAKMNDRWKSDTAINGGEGELAELGSVLKHNGTLKKGMAFRCGSMISKNNEGAPVVLLNAEHTFYYNFQNFGESEIHLTLQGVNNGKDVEGPVKDIDLLPGESVSISFSVTYTKGSPNRNVIGFYTVKEDIENMRLGASISVVLGRRKVAVSLKSGVEDFALNESYLAETRYVDDGLVLPAESDYTDTSAVKRTVIGWKDGEGNVLEGGEVLTGNIVLEPIFEYYANVTYTLPDGLSFISFDAVKEFAVGGTLALPKDANIKNDTGRAVLYWVLKGTNTRVTEQTVVEGDMEIEPVLEAEEKEEVAISESKVDGFTVAAAYFAKPQYKGELLVLPTESEYTNDTGKKLTGWKDKTTGALLTDGMPITLDSIVLEPVLVDYIKLSLSLPNGVAYAEEFKTDYIAGETLTLPDESALAGFAHTFLGWYDVETHEQVTNESVITKAMTIAPFVKTLEGYNFLALGSGHSFGFMAENAPGEIEEHKGDKSNSSVTDREKTVEWLGANSANKNGATQIIAGGKGYAMQGAVITDTAFNSAGTAFRIDTVHPQAVNADTVIEYVYSIENRGTSEIALSIYQIANSQEYRSGEEYYGYESRYRIDVRLGAGESMNAKAQYLLGANGNALTYVVLEKDLPSMSIGIAAGSRILNALDVADEYKGQAALNDTVAIGYDAAENEGVTVAEEYLERRVGRYTIAPTGEQFTAPSGVRVIGWKLVAGGKEYDLPSAITEHATPILPSGGASLKAVIASGVTVTYETSNGVSADGAATEYRQGDKLVLPELTAATTDGREHLGWFDKATGKAVTNDTEVMDNMKIAPYFAPKGTKLTPLSGATSSEKGCPYGPDNLKPGDTEGGPLNNKFAKAADVMGGDELGIRLDCTADLENGNAFRFKTSFGITAKQHTFTYNFTNYGAEQISFTVYQLASGTDTSDAPSESVTLGAGESVSVTLTRSFPKTNTNVLTYFIISGTVHDLSLGVSMSVTVA